jgi:hypothetical protein
MSDQDLQAEIEKLKAENEKLKTAGKGKGGISFRVSQKGAVSVYGLGRFPVTLYKEQWERLFGHIDELKDFIGENKDKLATK